MRGEIKLFGFSKKLKKDKRALGREVMAAVGLIVVATVFFVGLSINDGVLKASSIDSTSPFYNASEAITDGVSSSYSMGSVLMIVMIAGAIITTLLAAFGGFLMAR
jgi:hypothetical protein